MMSSNNRKPLEIERTRLSHLVALLTTAAVTGLMTWLIPGMAAWEQAGFLLHTVIGLALCLVLLPYAWIHFVRTLGLRRPALAITGLLALTVAVALSASGAWIAVSGQRETERLVLVVHIWTGLLVFATLLIHLLLHWWLLPKQRRVRHEAFPSITNHALRVSGHYFLASLALLLLATFLVNIFPSPFQDEPRIASYTYVYGENPFAPALTQTASGGFLDPTRIADSENCAQCHQDIAKQWRSSMHALAGSDKAYQKNISRLAEMRGIEAIRYCDGCHTPAALVGGELAEGGSLQSKWHMEEGIGCRSCHSIDEALHTRGNGSYRINPVDSYILAGQENRIARWLHDTSIKLNPDSHRTDVNRSLLDEARFCATCHVQFMDKSMNNWEWVKMQDEYLAWLNSPYSGHSDKPFATNEPVNCQDCHMPLVSANDPSANAEGQVRSHHFAAANMTIPAINGDMEQVERSRAFLQADRVRLSIVRPDRAVAQTSAYSASADALAEQERPAYFYIGETASIQVVVHNLGVGHNFPGGTTDINEAWIEFHVTDATDRTVFVSGAIDEQGHVDRNAYFYRSLPVNKHGQHVWNHELFNMIGDSYTNVIAAGAADLTSYELQIPGWVKSPLTVQATLRYRKFNQRYAEWGLDIPGINLPIADVAFDSLSLPIRERAEGF